MPLPSKQATGRWHRSCPTGMSSVERLTERLFGPDADVLGETDFQILLAISMVVILGTSLVSPILESLTGPFGVSTAEVGLIVSAFAAPPVVLITVGGVLTDRYGRKPVLTAGMVLFGLGGSGIAFTTDFRVALALRGLQGVGFAFTLPVVVTCIRDLFSGGREATAQGLRFATSGVSQIVFPVVAGSLVGVAWQFPFLLYATAFPVALSIHLWFDETFRRGSDEETPTDGERPGDSGRASSDTPDRKSYAGRLARLATRPAALSVIGGRTVMSVINFAFFTYNSLIIVRVLGGTPQYAALLIALWGGAYTVTSTQAGRITAVLPGRAVPLVVANLFLGGGLVVVAVAPSRHVAALGATCLGLGVGLGGPLYRSLLTGFAPGPLRGGLVGVGESVARLCATLTPAAMGLAIAEGERTLDPVTALQLVVGGTGVLVGIAGLVCVFVLYVAPAPTPRDSVSV